MFKSICMLTCALGLAQPSGRGAEWQLTPVLTPGLELVYRGTYVEESLIPNVQHQRHYKVETNLLVLEAGAKDWQVAVMTAMSLQDAAAHKTDGPTSVRLELGRVDRRGYLRGGDGKIMKLPLKGPPTLEAGLFVPAPLLPVARGTAWDVGHEGAPRQRWQVVGTESCGGVTCIKVAAGQQSADWDNPRADQSAWRRRDVLWLHPQFFVAQKIERVIEHRDPARDAPTFRLALRYELDSRLVYPGPLFEDRRKDILKAAKFHADADAVIRQPGRNRRDIDSLVQRVSFHLAHQPPTRTTPYRKAVLHVKAVLEKAQRGELPAPAANDEPTPHAFKTLAIGDRVPDFAVSSLTEEKAARRQDYQGKPVVVVFYNPETALGRNVIAYAKKLSANADWRILALAVTSDAEIARKQHHDLKLPFPIMDGNGMRLTFGVDHTPRFVVLDGNGLARLAVTGWGVHTSIEIEHALRACVKK